jgi:hypothetical protein
MRSTDSKPKLPRANAANRFGAISKFDWVTRPAQAGDETELDRIGGGIEHDRNGHGSRLCRQRRRSTGGGNDRDLTLNQVGRQRWKAVILAIGPAVFNRNIAAIDVTGFSPNSLRKAAENEA